MSWYEVAIEESDFSDAFKETLSREGFVMMQELLAMPVADLMLQNWFTVEMLEEIHRFIQKNKPV